MLKEGGDQSFDNIGFPSNPKMVNHKESQVELMLVQIQGLYLITMHIMES